MDDDAKVTVRLLTDDDGFVSQECPACERRFKARLGEGSDRPIAFCPYCGHNGEGCWWTKEQAEYLAAAVGGKVLGPELEEMARDFNRSSPKDDFLSVSMEVKRSPVPDPPEEPTDDWPTSTFDCCGETIKHDGQGESLHCIICGQENPISKE